ncbi:hypothetical protein Back2_18000 [Nocardioides baekrokdamisoli]|uniref:Phage tail protein n=1 Tax=Nocardioides baekrokdamisoli TaxID=1804624 RepID=A0A3G9IYJ7_9ACTN|nr:hypothetical protein [Nocardioides baekrokdamisoli]BBH17513.1 hypothetical protein Back2_18000 [Nocardioides baekrokdamisoli]
MTSTAVAARVYAALGQAFAAHAGPLLDPLVDVLAAPLDDSDQRLQLTAAGWARAFDLNQSPDPAWIGRLLGTAVPAGLTADQDRAFIIGRAYWKRGTPAAIVAAIKPLLGGQQTVTLVERDGSPWRLTVRVYASEVLPGVTVDDIAAAAATQKPVGIILTAQISAAATFAHLKAEHGPTFTAEAAAFPTFEAEMTHIPEEGTIA